MEIWRKQIEDQVKANSSKADLVKALNDLNKSILDVELKLVSRSEMLSDDKYFPEAYKVYMNLIWLSGGVGMGASDEAGSIDYKPTHAIRVLQLIEGSLRGGGRVRLAFSTTIPAFNKAMKEGAKIGSDRPGSLGFRLPASASQISRCQQPAGKPTSLRFHGVNSIAPFASTLLRPFSHSDDNAADTPSSHQSQTRGQAPSVSTILRCSMLSRLRHRCLVPSADD
jgi:hypothetical protein